MSRPRSNAFSGYEMHEALTGISRQDMTDMRLQYKRMKLATKAMAHARGIVTQPSNVSRQGQQQEQARFDEVHNVNKARTFVKQALAPQTKQNQQLSHLDDMTHLYGGVATTTSIKRQGNCMEMSALVLDYLGGKTRKYQGKLAQPDLSDDDRRKYQFKMQAIGDVHVMHGNDTEHGVNHMWVRMGKTDRDSESVSADAWGQGPAVRSAQYAGRGIFSSDQGNVPFSPERLAGVNQIRETSLARQHVVDFIQGPGLKHDQVFDPSVPVPSQRQHHNVDG